MASLENVLNVGGAGLKPFRLLDGKGYKTEEAAGGMRLVLDERGSSDVVNTGYMGPFAVVRSKSSKTAVKALSYNATEKRTWEALVFLGLTKIAVPETELTLSGPCFVYLEITVGARGAYSAEVKSAGSLPAQTASLLAVPLADVGFENGAVTKIVQLQYGNIHFPGRVF